MPEYGLYPAEHSWNMSCIRHTCPSRLEHVAIATVACAAGFISDMQTSPFGVCPSRRPDGQVGLARSARSPALQQANGPAETLAKAIPSMLALQVSLLVLKYRSSLVPSAKPRSPIQSPLWKARMSSEHRRTKSSPVHIRAPWLLQVSKAWKAATLVAKRLKQMLLSALQVKSAGVSTIAPSGATRAAWLGGGKVAGTDAGRQHRQVADKGSSL
mmetsp:Transcript_19626/g.74228  ORF Transcript_19626/g.74228 Transcript_19626/m.74228 type:complete len:214 (-) Transcript_19626:4364-5005(-)